MAKSLSTIIKIFMLLHKKINMGKYDALAHLVDLAADDDVLRKVRKSDGLRLSREFETLFDEVSYSDFTLNS